MSRYFLDTSALAKHYHKERGTNHVEALLAAPRNELFLSHLSIVELQSVAARRVRIHEITSDDFAALRSRFFADLTDRTFRVIRLTSSHFEQAEKLLVEFGLTQNLRTLDALQLAVALDLKNNADLDYFVCADDPLSQAASSMGLPVINPEHVEHAE